MSSDGVRCFEFTGHKDDLKGMSRGDFGGQAALPVPREGQQGAGTEAGYADQARLAQLLHLMMQNASAQADTGVRFNPFPRALV
jgi:hypothetical protein